MRHFLKIGEFDPLPLLMQLERNEELWDQNADRITRSGTAHRDVNDIWLRYRAREELKCDQDFQEPHFPVWYPAINKLFEARELAQQVIARTKATMLGGCLITRIPPGGQVLPHSDTGWHPNHYRTKVYCVLKNNPNCINYCAGEAIVMQPGACYIFNNLIEHSVVNNGDDDRISLIIALKCD